MAKFNYSVPHAPLHRDHRRSTTGRRPSSTAASRSTARTSATSAPTSTARAERRARTRDGEHSVSPSFARTGDIGEIEIMRGGPSDAESVALTLDRTRRLRQVPRRPGLRADRHVRGSGLWGFMTGCVGLDFSPRPAAVRRLRARRRTRCARSRTSTSSTSSDRTREMLQVRHRAADERAADPGATYSTHDMGMTFELAEPGELYMICQGSRRRLRRRARARSRAGDEGPPRGPHLERPPARSTGWFDPETAVVDVEATAAARDAERAPPRARQALRRVRPELGNRAPRQPAVLRLLERPQRAAPGNPGAHLPADAIAPVYMPDPKDVRIAQLEAKLAELQS